MQEQNFAEIDGERRMNRRMNFRVMATLLAALALAGASRAQAPAAAPDNKAAEATAAQRAHEEQMKNDWPWLGRFKQEDLQMGAPAAGENRVVFMGDSITESWKLDSSFPGKPYVNRGISGQTTPQMVLRFRQDVIDLKPKVVVILAGTNDIAGNTGPMTLEETEGNLASMAELASANGIKVVLCSVLPAYDYPWKPGLEPAAKIVAVNAWMKRYAAERGFLYVDYHTAMKDARDGLPAALSSDGVHPNAAGYAVMTPLAQAGIEKALGKSRD
jgi:lysophospholipase L1-like esterase